MRRGFGVHALKGNRPKGKQASWRSSVIKEMLFVSALGQLRALDKQTDGWTSLDSSDRRLAGSDGRAGSVMNDDDDDCRPRWSSHYVFALML